MKFRYLSLISCVFLACFFAVAHSFAQEVTPAQRAQFEGVIKDYLLKNPEIVRDAMLELDRKEKDAENQARLKITADKNSLLYTSANAIVVGNPKGDVTLVEFFDYNCPYCRNSAKDLLQLVKTDKNLGYILINYAVLSEASILAAKVALAFSMQKVELYASFHQKLFERKGVIGGDHAIYVATNLGADKVRLIKDADSDMVTKALIASAKLGENLGFVATPSYIIGNTGVQGYASLVDKKRFVGNMRACEKAVC